MGLLRLARPAEEEDGRAVLVARVHAAHQLAVGRRRQARAPALGGARDEGADLGGRLHLALLADGADILAVLAVGRAQLLILAADGAPARVEQLHRGELLNRHHALVVLGRGRCRRSRSGRAWCHNGHRREDDLAAHLAHAHARHLLVDLRDGDALERGREARVSTELAPAADVVLDRLLARVHNGARALAVAAGAAEQRLQVRVVLVAHAVVEHADELVLERLGRVEHVLEHDEGVLLGRDLEHLVDVLNRLESRARVLATRRALRDLLLRVELEHIGLGEGRAQLGHDGLLLAVARAHEVVARRVREGLGDAALELAHGLVAVEVTVVLCEADARSRLQLLDALVRLRRLKADDLRVLLLLDQQDLGGVRGADGQKADVVLLPLLAGAEQRDLSVHRARAVVDGGREVALVKDDEDIRELTAGGERAERHHHLGEAAAVVHIRAHALREAVARLLLPGVVAHARQNKDPVGADLELVGVAQHEADESSHDARLARLHLCREVDPGALHGLHEEGEKALRGGEHLRRVRLLCRERLVGVPPELGDPEHGLEGGSGNLERDIGEVAGEGHGRGHLGRGRQRKAEGLTEGLIAWVVRVGTCPAEYSILFVN